MKTRIAIFPGSFDPFTIGHQHVVTRALSLFDRLIIGIGRNTAKKMFYTPEERMAQIEVLYKDNSAIEVRIYDALTVDLAREVGAEFILRSVRTVADFEYERTIADANRQLGNVETVILFTDASTGYISSSLVRELLSFGKDVSDYLPQLPSNDK